MYLSRLIIHNFRIFDHFEIDLEPATVVVGPNGVGKSTIVDALRFLLEPRDRFGRTWTYASVRNDNQDWDEPTFVIGEFTGLSEADYQRWGKAPNKAGSLWLGSRLVDWKRRGEQRGEWPGRFGTAVLVPGPRKPAEESSKGEMALQPGDGRTWWLTSEFLALAAHDFDSINLVDAVPQLVHVPGPETSQPSIATLLQPLLRLRARTALDRMDIQYMDLAHAVGCEIQDVGKRLARATRAVDPHVTGAFSAGDFDVDARPLDDTFGFREAQDALLDALVVTHMPTLQRKRGDVRLSADDPAGWGIDALVATGAGTSRALAISALAIYGDPDLWPADRSLVIAIEEPEVGLHPAAQRQVAQVLRHLANKGRQSLVLSHAASMVDTAPRRGVRCLRLADDGAVKVGDLGSVADSLGLAPSDILQASVFVVVEGPSDAAIFEVWARKLGHSETSDVRFVSAGSWSKTEGVARIVEVTHPLARIIVALDAGTNTTREAAAIARRHEGRVVTHVLVNGAIEAYLGPRAIEAWLVAQGATEAEASDATAWFGDGLRWFDCDDRRWKAACGRILHRGYHKLADGPEIAEIMTPGEIGREIVDLLEMVYSSPEP